MSKYTAMRRSGGGLLTAQILNTIVSADFDGPEGIALTYARPVSVATLNSGNFQTLPDGEPATALQQNGPNRIDVTFSNDITAESDITFVGNTAAFTSPQTIEIT